MYDVLFQKGKIGNVELKNLLVMSPMGTNLAQLDGSPGDDMIVYYEERAKGGAGLIIPEICRVNEASRPIRQRSFRRSCLHGTTSPHPA